MHHEQCLLLRALYGYEMHVGSSHGLADGLGVVRVVLAAFAVGDHKLRRHEPHGVPECRELPGPVMRAITGLHANETRRQLREVLQHLRSRQGLVELGDPMFVHAVHLKNLFGNVQSDSCNLHGDSPCSVIERGFFFNLAHPMP